MHRGSSICFAILSLLFVACIVSSFHNIPIVNASGTVYIDVDGNVVGTDMIQREGDLYTFVGDISDEIVIERDNIVVDGANYSVLGMGAGSGIRVESAYTVTIKNLRITNFYTGISVNASLNIVLLGNVVTESHHGIYLRDTCYSNISGNYITDNEFGIYLYGSSNNLISDNDIANDYGIGVIHSSCNNRIFHNNFMNTIAQLQSTDSSSTSNIWDDGYPSGGNYWINYEQKYPDAAEIDSSGIWDTPYIVNQYYSSNVDNYPLMNQYVIPEFPSLLILTLFMTATLLAFIVYKRKQTYIH
jgi:parallel beta-helix repeat protein